MSDLTPSMVEFAKQNNPDDRLRSYGQFGSAVTGFNSSRRLGSAEEAQQFKAQGRTVLETAGTNPAASDNNPNAAKRDQAINIGRSRRGFFIQPTTRLGGAIAAKTSVTTLLGE